MRIAQIAPLWIPVPPRTYGGIELFLSLLTEELVARGHEVFLFASEDSITKATLIAGTEKALWTRKDLRSPHAVINRYLKMVHDRLHLFDIIHNHADFFMFPLVLGNDKVPMVTTLHRPIDAEEAKVLRSFPSINYLAISYDQKKSAEEQNIKIMDVVYNGINPKEYEFNNSPEDYFLFLGRLNKEKGVVAAIEIAKAADKKLVVAGNIAGPAEWNYFFRDVQPRLNSDKISFVGEVDFKEKIKLLKNAKALLFPINRREPFGLVMIEAMACGTPVIAFNRGSVPEVIEDKKTGFVVEGKEQMIEAMENIDKIKRKDCRRAVEKNFTLKQMVDKYEDIYKKLIS